MSISNYAENKILDHLFGTAAFTMPAQVYVALHTADPGETGATAEVSGGSYARQAIDFDAAANGATSNSATVTFSGMPGVTVTHVSIWDAATAGNCLFVGALTQSQALPAGSQFVFNAGDAQATLD